jgi:hypothetical protein
MQNLVVVAVVGLVAITEMAVQGLVLCLAVLVVVVVVWLQAVVLADAQDLEVQINTVQVVVRQEMLLAQFYLVVLEAVEEVQAHLV